ncbi:MAG: hypothetical protein MJ211_15800 [Bacteroidales bacterium]|nr:hypothetical protein [Bacteroidales bacterium]
MKYKLLSLIFTLLICNICFSQIEDTTEINRMNKFLEIAITQEPQMYHCFFPEIYFGMSEEEYKSTLKNMIKRNQLKKNGDYYYIDYEKENGVVGLTISIKKPTFTNGELTSILYNITTWEEEDLSQTELFLIQTFRKEYKGIHYFIPRVNILGKNEYCWILNNLVITFKGGDAGELLFVDTSKIGI